MKTFIRKIIIKLQSFFPDATFHLINDRQARHFYSRHLFLLMVLFLLITLVACVGEGNIDQPNDSTNDTPDWSSARTIVVGDSVIGDIETLQGIDIFEVSLTAQTKYWFELQGSPTMNGTLSDPELIFYDSNGSFLDHDSDSGVGFNSRITYVPVTSGVYYLVASGLHRIGTYTLSVIADDTPDNRGTTRTVAVGESVTGNIEIAQDIDVFQLMLTAETRYQFNLEGSPAMSGALSDPELIFYDSNGFFLAYDSDSGAGFNSRIDYMSDSSGVHYLVARGFGRHTGTYKLTIALLP